MNRNAITSLLLVTGLAFAASANAGDATAAEPGTQVIQADAGDAAKDENVVISASGLAKAEPVADTGCVRSSGTLARRRVDANGCNGQPGSSYSREELQRSGGMNTADALKRLDARL